ncbi:hypothetical protein G6F31_015224 [Rhizopus arrhizus]|nr:hypothetical protein G6F31_015224 [Rhizopus arrhizus]
MWSAMPTAFLDLHEALDDQEQATDDQHQVADGDAPAGHGEKVGGQVRQIGQRHQQRDTRDARHGDPELACERATFFRQLADRDGNEHQVVDAEHDFQRTQGEQGHPGIGVGEELKGHGNSSRQWGNGVSAVAAGQHVRNHDQRPAQQYVHHQHEHRRRAHVLGAAGQFVDFAAVAFDHRLDGRVGQLHRQHQQHRADHQRAFDRGLAQPDRDRGQHDQQVDLQPERGLVQPGGAKTLPGPAGGLEDAARAAGQVAELISHGRKIQQQERGAATAQTHGRESWVHRNRQMAANK